MQFDQTNCVFENTVYERHDLMMQLGRLESAIEKILCDESDRHGQDFVKLEIERARIDGELRKLSHS